MSSASDAVAEVVAVHVEALRLQREADAALVEAAGCRCLELADSRVGAREGTPCVWCLRPKAEHGSYGFGGESPCPDPSKTSQFYSPNGPRVVLEHSPACPESLAAKIRGGA
jgi:hypothetical protein